MIYPKYFISMNDNVFRYFFFCFRSNMEFILTFILICSWWRRILSILIIIGIVHRLVWIIMMIWMTRWTSIVVTLTIIPRWIHFRITCSISYVRIIHSICRWNSHMLMIASWKYEKKNKKSNYYNISSFVLVIVNNTKIIILLMIESIVILNHWRMTNLHIGYH